MKKRIRYVDVDVGYMTAESWTRCRVVGSRQVNCLFSQDTTEELLVQFPDGSRDWVSFWRDVDEP